MAALDLRPLSLGELLDRTFFLYRRHFLLFFGIAAIPYSIFFVVHLVTALLPILAGPGDYGNMRAARFVTASIGGGLFGFVGAFVGGVAYLFSLGATVYGVSEIYKGRETTIRECLRHVRGKTGIIFGVLILSGLLVIAGLIALVIPGIYLLCRICVAVSAALLEDTRRFDTAELRAYKEFCRARIHDLLALLCGDLGGTCIISIPFHNSYRRVCETNSVGGALDGADASW